MPTWLIRYFDNLINPNENVAFSVSPLCTFVRVCNRPMVGLVINPVYWLISQQPGPIKKSSGHQVSLELYPQL